MTIGSTEEAIKIFADAAIKHGEASEQGKYRVGNRSYKYLVLAVQFLRKKNQVDLLKRLLQHDDSGVRIWSATYLLFSSYKNIAEKILKKESLKTGLRAFSAEMVLKQWHEGALKLL